MNWPEKVAARYRLVGQVGAGGMGLVYKAIDTRLDRAVAIKAINRAKLEKAGSSEKLRLEAMAAASLDHPYICRIYELIDEDADTFIVMEFVEGETLAAMMQRGPLPLAEALRLASEIAEGLANAHARGLVHRDIKPANVMVTPHGHVKLLDFGIAQPDVAATPDAHTKTSPDAPMGHGGTPHYMSPEQAIGGPVTARADLFALGVVIYECVTGRLPFEGTTDYDYVHHLIATAPKPMHKLAPDAPEELVSLVEQCLERTPAHRPDSAVSVANQLRRISGLLSAPSGALESVTSVRRRRRRVVAIAAALVALAVVGIVAWQWMQPKWLAVGRDRPVTTSPGKEFGSRISPDGKWVLFIGTRGDARQVFVQQIDALQPQVVSLPPGLYEGCVWSPDQARLACLGRQGDQLMLQVVPAFGGAVLQSIAMPDGAGSVQLVRWIDASIYLVSRVSRGQTRGALALQRLNLPTNDRTDVPGGWTTIKGVEELDLRPDGREVVVVVTVQGEGRELWVADVGGAKSERLTPEDDRSMKAMPVWSTDGRSIVYQSNLGGQADLWEIDRRTGRQRRLTTSPAIERPESVSIDGSVSFQLIDESAALWSWPIGAPGAGRPLNEEALSAFAPTLSREGRMLAFQRSLPSPREGFLVMDSMLVAAEIDRQSLRNLRDVREGFLPRLSPDGTRLAYFQRAAAGRARVLVMTLETGETQTLSESGTFAANLPSFPVVWWDQPLVWSPSGDALYFVERDETTSHIRRFRVSEGKNGLATLVSTPIRISNLHVSSSGRLIAYLASRSTNAEQSSPSAREFELRVLDVESKNDVVWATFPAGSRMSCRGWAPGAQRVVLARSGKQHDDGTHSIEVLSVSAPNQVRSLGTIDHVVQQTLRLSASKPLLYMTRSEAGVANVFAFALDTRSMTPITDNALVDVTFGSVEALGPDRLAGVRDVRKHDIWLLDARSQAAGKPSPASR